MPMYVDLTNTSCVPTVCVVSKGIVELHGGTISVHSEGEGLGSTFRVELPLICEKNVAGDAILDVPAAITDIDAPLAPPTAAVAKLPEPRRRSVRWSSLEIKSEDTDGDGEGNGVLRSPSKNLSMVNEVDCLREYEKMTSSALEPYEVHILGDRVEGKYDESKEGSNRCMLVAGHMDRLRRKEESGVGVGYCPDMSSARVLVVDDSTIARKMICRSLHSSYLLIEEAIDGADAVAKVKESLAGPYSYDLILMDYFMPNMDGPTATKLIREELGFKGKIIGVTGNALIDDIQTFVSHGVDRVLIKPVDIHVLRNILF